MWNHKPVSSAKVLALLLAMLLAALACSVEGANTVSTQEDFGRNPASLPPSERNRELTAQSSIDEVYKIVCNSGGLNVRSCAGTSCELALEIPLQDGEAVVATMWTKKSEDGGTWIHIVEPAYGWVNIKFLCDPGST